MALGPQFLQRLTPDYAFQRALKSSMTPRQATRLRALNDWREEQARRRDLPRGFVLKDEMMVELARRGPESKTQLRELPSLKPLLERPGVGRLLSLLRVAEQTEEEQLTEPIVVTGAKGRRVVEKLRQVVSERAAELPVPPEFLASKKTVEELVALVQHGQLELPGPLHGWRRALVGDELLTLAQQSI